MTPKKLSVLHVAKAQLGLDDETYRAVLQAQGGVESATELDDRGFDAVMARFRELGWSLDRQQGFSQRMCKKAWPQTRREANRVIEALKAMAARGYKGRES